MNENKDYQEFTQEMPYKGGAHGAETPQTGYVAGTHAHITDKVRKEQLKDIGFQTREEYVDCEAENKNIAKEIKRQRITRISLIFLAFFALSLAVGALVGEFMAGGNVLIGLGVGAGVFAVLTALALVVNLVTNRKK